MKKSRTLSTRSRGTTVHSNIISNAIMNNNVMNKNFKEVTNIASDERIDPSHNLNIKIQRNIRSNTVLNDLSTPPEPSRNYISDVKRSKQRRRRSHEHQRRKKITPRGESASLDVRKHLPQSASVRHASPTALNQDRQPKRKKSRNLKNFRKEEQLIGPPSEPPSHPPPLVQPPPPPSLPNLF
eukprot:TRINITY_DN4743_c0_g1_i1.p1 TRINITY_DN4743_c0_g1~~TRINITY_DN4743_c0_g1_i1.p1  ORF type:complete len:183 (+),score=21.07 TRINITY_DN4743_c0_g1_i1:238-786(+)